MVDVFLKGHPRSTQTGTIAKVRGRSFPLRRNTAWSRSCAVQMKSLLGAGPFPRFSVPVWAYLIFYFPRPKRGTTAPYPRRRLDADNLAKGLLDGWREILWQDDSQIIELTVRKAWEGREGPGVRVRVDPL